MPWQNDIVSTLRVILGDLNDPPTYNDSRLEMVSVVAASQVLIETDFDRSYIVDISQLTISPDPADSSVYGAKDGNFMALIAMKAAVLIAKSELKLNAPNMGLEVRDGPSTVKTDGVYAAYIGLYKQFLQDYEYLRFNYRIVRSTLNSQACLSPTTVRQIYGNLEVLGY